MDTKKNIGPDFEGIGKQWQIFNDRGSLQEENNRSEWTEFGSTCNLLDEMKEIETFDTDQAWNKLFNRLDGENLIPDQPARILKLNWYQWAAAASIILLLGISTIWIMQNQNRVSTSMNTILASDVQLVVLTDGSTVNLNKGASLTYPELFNDTIRKVILKGEAYFQITKNPTCPFVIETDMAKIRVLGTSFNVDMQNNHLQVTVSSGKVQLATINPNPDAVVLIPGETGFTDGKMVSKNPNTNANYLSWLDKKLIFKATPLDKVINDIEKTYQVSIDANLPNTDSYLLSATFDKASLDEVVKAVSLTFNLKVEYKTEKNIIFQKND